MRSLTKELSKMQSKLKTINKKEKELQKAFIKETAKKLKKFDEDYDLKINPLKEKINKLKGEAAASLKDTKAEVQEASTHKYCMTKESIYSEEFDKFICLETNGKKRQECDSLKYTDQNVECLNYRTIEALSLCTKYKQDPTDPYKLVCSEEIQEFWPEKICVKIETIKDNMTRCTQHDFIKPKFRCISSSPAGCFEKQVYFEDDSKIKISEPKVVEVKKNDVTGNKADRNEVKNVGILGKIGNFFLKPLIKMEGRVLTSENGNEGVLKHLNEFSEADREILNECFTTTTNN